MFNNPYKIPNEFSSTGYLSTVPDKQLFSMTVDDFFLKRVVIKNISISRALGRTIRKWLSDNPSYVVSSFKSGTYLNGEVTYDTSTAYFTFHYSYDDGCDESHMLEPSYLGDKNRESTTPTMLELWFGLKKKYPQEILSVNAEFADISQEEHLSIMHKSRYSP